MQAEHALRIYFVNFLKDAEWDRRPTPTVVDAAGGVDPLAALEQMRQRIRTRHYAYRTEVSYIDWAPLPRLRRGTTAGTTSHGRRGAGASVGACDHCGPAAASE